MENTETAETVASEATHTESSASIDVLGEIKNAVAIIDHAAEQGAFKGWGIINQVLGVRGRLLAFADLMEQAIRQANPEAFAEEADGTDDTTDDGDEMVQDISDEVEAAIDQAREAAAREAAQEAAREAARQAKLKALQAEIDALQNSTEE